MGAGGGGELQVAVAVNAGDGGAEGLAGVDVVGFDAEAVEASQVVGLDGGGSVGLAQLKGMPSLISVRIHRSLMSRSVMRPARRMISTSQTYFLKSDDAFISRTRFL